MNASATRIVPPRNPLVAVLLSLIVPGAGQFVQNRRERGLAILVAMLVNGYLIFWALDNFHIGELAGGAVGGSWLIAASGPVLGMERAGCLPAGAGQANG